MDIPTITLNRARLTAQARPAAYIAANGYLTLNSIVSETFKMPPAKQLLYMTIMMAAVQRLMRGNELPDDLRDATALPDAYVGYVSRRALAAATGLSRETVRRMVLEMLDEGLLSQGPRGGLAAKSGVLAQAHVQTGLAALVAGFGAITTSLLNLGVLEVRDLALRR
jgi:hypothetical protein